MGIPNNDIMILFLLLLAALAWGMFTNWVDGRRYPLWNNIREVARQFNLLFKKGGRP
ncbi:MAG: hypothetical protein UW95_C0003G0050 [Parcubacteria group bacterium GW2011_GWC1_45_14]|nr:MAG: hypothetical protein UW87_C0002G0038 [Candidatus Moranbacteria bacterium GW2011_GWC2_45_10]KKT95208.1 MAG: hypothetical protein UW95_C0003G0050 [Parcubacteria group bacterium GW2011_GWC1_45_14]